MHPSRRTWRIRGIPRDVDREWLARALRHHSDLRWPSGNGLEGFEDDVIDVIIHTLAPDHRINLNYQVATVRFHSLPPQLDALGPRGELTVKINMDLETPGVIQKSGLTSEVFIDEHFDGITTLFSPATDEMHQVDMLVVPGLGSHPFGSFVHKKDGNMWLTNNLPRDMPTARVMIFGYDSKLEHSRSHVELDDLAGPVHIAISQISQSKKTPLILVGHSLGGLLVKEALIRSAELDLEHGLSNPLDMVTGILLFGTPNDGLDIESLVPMVNDQPNRSLLESLSSTGSQMLRRQRKDFSKVLESTNLRLFCLYETELSPTATQDIATREWKMGGPLRFLVSQSSATSCLPPGAPSNHSVSIRRNHSNLVKFSPHDAEYDKVAYILQQMLETSTSHSTQRKARKPSQVLHGPQQRHPVSSQTTKLIREFPINDLVKRPADERLSASVEKRPRLVSYSPENDPSEAGVDPALRDPGSRGGIGSIKEELISRLYFSKIDDRLTHLAPAQGTTCRWFLTGSAYQSWQDVAQQPEHGGFIWIKGNPGTGKSTLMKYLFEATKINSQKDASRITLSFFFLARGMAEEKTTTGLYRSLLHQLFEIASDLKDSLTWMTLDGARTIQQSGWSEEALKQTLKHALPKLGNRSLTIFIDALDECDAEKADDMVSFFEELCECAAESNVRLQICFSSRYYPTVVIQKGLEVCLEDEIGHAEDIRKYVKSRLRLKSNSKNTEALRCEILEKSSRIFLWVVLVVDILNKETSLSIQRLREHLKRIPPGLDDLFRMILSRDGENLEQLQLCLNWILFASRALKPQELYFAIYFGSDDKCLGFWDEKDLDLDDMKTFVRNSSKGLAEVTRNKASEVQFIHESVRDFLLGKYGTSWSGTSENLPGHGHRLLRDCCLAQINTSISQQIEIPDPLPRASQMAELRKSIGWTFPFLKYSVHNVLHHSNLAQRNGIAQGHFLSEFPLQRWVFINNILERFDVRRFTESVSLLYILGEKDLADLIRIHSERKSCFQVEPERYDTPMFAALANNSREAIREFLKALAENESPTSPLHRLCERYEHQGSKTATFSRAFTPQGRSSVGVFEDLIEDGEEAVAVAFILSPQAHDLYPPGDSSYFFRLLSNPSVRAHEGLLRVLLERAALSDQDSWFFDSLLLRAVSQRSEFVVDDLLNGGVDVQLSCQGRRAALQIAASIGQAAIVKLLVDKGVDISRHDDGEAALSLAVRKGHTAVVKDLLEKGANIESRGKDGRTPLSFAVRQSGMDIVRLLVEEGADIESRDESSQTPLSLAARQSRIDVVKLLLEKGADVDSKDEAGQTPLSLAARHSYADIVKLLLEKGADVDSKDACDRTPLSWAAGQSCSEIAELLLEEGADIESRDKYDRTPLSWAAGKFGHKGAVAMLLLERSADIHSKDKDGRTPLSWAAGNPGIAKNVAISLLEKGADIESKDNHGRTPLSWAAGNDALLAASLLFDKGADVDSQDHDGYTPLSWALSNQLSLDNSAFQIVAMLRGRAKGTHRRVQR